LKAAPEQVPGIGGWPGLHVARVAEGDRKRSAALPYKSIASCALRASGQQVARTTQDAVNAVPLDQAEICLEFTIP